MTEGSLSIDCASTSTETILTMRPLRNGVFANGQSSTTKIHVKFPADDSHTTTYVAHDVKSLEAATANALPQPGKVAEPGSTRHAPDSRHGSPTADASGSSLDKQQGAAGERRGRLAGWQARTWLWPCEADEATRRRKSRSARRSSLGRDGGK